jgi:uncharacterized protein
MSDSPEPEFTLREPGPLRCPKCQSTMAPVTVVEVEVDRCTGCGGLWFDLLEHEDLKRVDLARQLDTGDPRTGERYDQVGLIRCPVDGEPMIRMVDTAHPDLWLESCPVCYGTFFDAGEFREFAHHRLRDMLVRNRRPRPL